MSRTRLCTYDFETTGISNNDYPIQIALKLVELEGGKEVRVKEYSNYIKSPIPVPARATSINGITDAILREKGISPEQASKEINELINVPDTLIIGHNIIGFDNRFMNRFLPQFGYKPIDTEWSFDTAAHFKAHLIGESMRKGETFETYHKRALYTIREGIKYRLPLACSYYGIKTKESSLHNAIHDVNYTFELFKVQCQDHTNAKPINKDTLDDENRVTLGFGKRERKIEAGLF